MRFLSGSTAVPNTSLRELTVAATDADGVLWPAGTQYRVLSGTESTQYVLIDGQPVTFNAGLVAPGGTP